jgi:hypothetical protein
VEKTTNEGALAVAAIHKWLGVFYTIILGVGIAATLEDTRNSSFLCCIFWPDVARNSIEAKFLRLAKAVKAKVVNLRGK